jgi:predicted metal-dependent HD superfamily phosphohydrolase
MSQKVPDFDAAKSFVFSELSQLDGRLWYHGRHHTFEDVLPNAEILCKSEGLSPEDTLLVKTAALYHDTGFLDIYDKNEPYGCDRARKSLPRFGYSDEQIESICVMIMATQLPQSPKNHLSEIVCDADLAHLGGDHIFLRAESLRLEIEQYKGVKTNLRSFNEGNIKFFKNHKYFTESAKKTLQPKKEKSIQQLQDFLDGK